MKHSILLPSGREISSGQDGAAICSVKLTHTVAAGTEPVPGAVCAAMARLVLFGDGNLTVSAGDRFTLWEDGVLVGTFLAEKPTWNGSRMELTAYDTVTLLDRELAPWLGSLTQWPYRLDTFAGLVCQACGLTLAEGDIPNGSFLIPKFAAASVTGRQLLRWAAQAAGRWCTALPDGTLSFGWYQDGGRTLAPSGEAFYFQGSLSMDDYRVAPVDRVRIALTEEDLGVSWPESGENTLTVRGNYLLTGDTETLTPVAQGILEAVGGLTFTPCRVSCTLDIRAGELFRVRDLQGRETLCCAMTVESAGEKRTVEGTGSQSLESGQALCGGDFQALSGRVLELKASLESLRSRMTLLQEDSQQQSLLQQQVDTLTAQVSRVEADLTARSATLTQQADSLELAISRAEGELTAITERFRFDETGLTVSDSATGMGIGISQEQVAFSGGTTVIYPNRMATTNLTVGSSLALGDFSFFPRTNGNLSFRWTGGAQ